MYRIAKRGTATHEWAAGVLRGHRVEKTLRPHKSSRLEKMLSASTIASGALGLGLFLAASAVGVGPVAGLPALMLSLVPSVAAWTLLKALTIAVPACVGDISMETDQVLRAVRREDVKLARQLRRQLHAHVDTADSAEELDSLSEDVVVEVEDPWFDEVTGTQVLRCTEASDLVRRDIEQVLAHAWLSLHDGPQQAGLGKAPVATESDRASRAAARARAQERFVAKRSFAQTVASREGAPHTAETEAEFAEEFKTLARALS